jgi:hypothetical protein
MWDDDGALAPLRQYSRTLGPVAAAAYDRLRSLIEPPSGVLEGEAAERYFLQQIERCEQDCRRQVEAFPSNWWLLYLRILSPILFWCHTPGYSRYRGFTEALTATSTRSRSAELMPWGRPQLARAVRLLASCTAVEDLRADHRRAVVTGVRVEPTASGYNIVVPPAVNRAFANYEHRLLWNDLYAAATYAGTHVFGQLGWRPKTPAEANQAFVLALMPPLMLSEEELHADDTADERQFVAALTRLSFDSAQVDWSITGEAGLQFIRATAALLHLYIAEVGDHDHLMKKVSRSGLGSKAASDVPVFLGRVADAANSWAPELFPGSAPDITADGVGSLLSGRMTARLGRYFGPVLRPGDDFAVIDLVAAGLHLETSISEVLAAQGTGNPQWRGTTWEEVVQEGIRTTLWRPTERAVRQVERHPRLDGELLTDIDAFGVVDRRLLIVSCKSWQMPGRYQVGDWSQVGRRGEAVLEASRALSSKLERLRARPVGDNYDFSGFSEITGAVCISAPFLFEHLLEPGEQLGVPIYVLPELVAQLNHQDIRPPDGQFWKDILRAFEA